jgi:hypothetical protein
MRQVQVEVARKEDFGVNDRTFTVNTHLGEILKFNDTVLAYDMIQSATSSLDDHEKVDKYLPDVIIVKKTFPKYRKRQRNRIWKLKHFEDKVEENRGEVVAAGGEVDEDEDMAEAGNTKPQEKKKSKKALKREAKQEKDIKKHKDYELFLQDIEDDPDFRANVNLYKDDDVIGQLEAQIGNMNLDDTKESSLKTVLDKGIKLTAGEERPVKKAVRKTAIGKAIQHQSEKQRQKSEMISKANMKSNNEMKLNKDDESDWESAEEDAPTIKLEDLLNNLKIDDPIEMENAEEQEEGEEESKQE